MVDIIIQHKPYYSHNMNTREWRLFQTLHMYIVHTYMYNLIPYTDT